MKIGTLDYERAHIRMCADNKTEEYIRLRSCAKEPECVTWLQSFAAAIFYDVGANVGAYSLIARARGCVVVCFEPAPANIARLRENFALNVGPDPIVVPLALSDISHVARLGNADEAGHTHWIGDEGIRILCAPLDDLVSRYELPLPDAIKIDVDGHEIQVLLGARRVLQECVTVLIETVPDTAADCATILNDSGLRVESSHPHKSGVTNTIWRR